MIHRLAMTCQQVLDAPAPGRPSPLLVRPAASAAFLAASTARIARHRRVTQRLSSVRILAAMDDLLDTLHALRLLWLPSLVLGLAAGAGLALIAWG